MSSLKFTSITPVKPDKARLIERLRETQKFPIYEAMVDLLPLNPREVVVYGYTNGSFVRQLAQKSKHLIVGEAMVGKTMNVGLERIKGEYLECGPLDGGSVDFVKMESGHMQVQSRSADAYVMLASQWDPRSHENVICEAARILTNDGKFILSLPNVEVYPHGTNGGIASLGYTKFTGVLWKHFGLVRLFGHGQVHGFSKVISDARKLLLKLGMLDFCEKHVPVKFYAWLFNAFHGDLKAFPISQIGYTPSIYLLAVCEKPIRG